MILADFRLPRRVRRTLEALAPVVCPPDLGELGILEPLVDHCELTLRSFSPPVRAGLHAGLVFFELSAAAVPSSRGRTFSRLGPAAAEAHFARFWHSRVGPLHQLARGMKALVAFAYYEHPVVKRRMEYHPERWIAEVARRRLERWGDAIRRHEQAILAPDPLVPTVALARKHKQDKEGSHARSA